MSYMYEPPSIIDTYKSKMTGDNKELIYKNFLLQRLVYLDIDSVSIDEADNMIKNALLGREKIPYIIQLEYTNDEDFRNYIKSNYSDLANEIDVQAEKNNRSEAFNAFYQYFININDQGYRFVGYITEKQVVFQRTKENNITDINDPEGANNHDTLAQMYCEKMNISNKELKNIQSTNIYGDLKQLQEIAKNNPIATSSVDRRLLGSDIPIYKQIKYSGDVRFQKELFSLPYDRYQLFFTKD